MKFPYRIIAQRQDDTDSTLRADYPYAALVREHNDVILSTTG